MMRMLKHRKPALMAAGFAVFSNIALIGCGKEERYAYVPDKKPEASAPMATLSAPISRPSASAGPFAAAGGRASDSAGPAASPGIPTGRGCQEGMARIRNFCMDRFEIILEGRDGTAYPHFQIPPRDLAGLRARSVPGVFPQGHMSQEAAVKACRNAGKRLCSLDEWQAACTGSGARRFPYGNDAVAGMCNAGRRSPHILDKHFPDVPHMKRTGKHFNDPALLQDPDYLMRTGQKPGCVTPEGVYDIDGNLSEWVSDTIQKGGRTHGTFAGDAFSGYGNAGCSRKTAGHSADYHDYSMGTRCCANPGR